MTTNIPSPGHPAVEAYLADGYDRVVGMSSRFAAAICARLLRLQTEEGVSGPIAEGIRFRIAGSYVDTQGYIDNAFLGEEADPYRDFSLRGNLLIDAAPGLSFDIRGSMARLRTQALYFNIVADVNDTSLPVRVNNAGQNDRDIYNLSLKIDYETDAGTLTSVSSYDTLTEILTGDAFDFLPIPESLFFNILGFDMNQSQFLDVKAWSQEIRFASPADRPFQWMVGAYAIGTDRYISTGNMVDSGNGVFPAGGKASPGDRVGAFYSDESHIQARDYNDPFWATQAGYPDTD